MQKKNKTIVVTSGYFNPLHRGHLNLFREAKKLGDYLIVIVNNDKQVALKGSKHFMDEEERADIVNAIRYVDEVVIAVDSDRSIKQTLRHLPATVFAKGGDSNPENVPELDLCHALGIKVVLGVGGDKVQSSSWLKNDGRSKRKK